jgi:hypothetical protein
MLHALPASAGSNLRTLALALAVLLAVPASASGATTTTGEVEAPRWSLRGDGNYYYLPDGTDYPLFVGAAKRGLLHLEARYNYEDLRTVSTFLGLNFGLGESLRLELTPMLGVVAGTTSGVAPGLELELSYWKLVLYSEIEYVFALVEPSDSFFHSWTELSLWPVDWGRVGVIFERTKVIETGFDLERGFLVGLTYRRLSAAVHVINPGADAVYSIFTLSVEL